MTFHPKKVIFKDIIRNALFRLQFVDLDIHFVESIANVIQILDLYRKIIVIFSKNEISNGKGS